MQAIVISKCYGGFGLSRAAILRYATIKGVKVYPYRDKFSMQHNTDPKNDLFMHWATVRVEDGGECPEEAYWNPRSIARDDLALVQVVREMGADANTQFSNLKVVEIPDGIEWDIEEYDGREWVAEKHEVWS